MATEKVEPINQLSENDHAMLRKALEGTRRAQTQLEFVSSHLSDCYKLDRTCRIDEKTGAITRGSPEPKDT